jgi:hypothetical protein
MLKFISSDVDNCLQHWKKLESASPMIKVLQAKSHASILKDIGEKLKHAVNNLMVRISMDDHIVF